MLEERELLLQAQQQRCDEGRERLEWLVKALGTVRAGVEHLTDKLQHIALVNTASATTTLLVRVPTVMGNLEKVMAFKKNFFYTWYFI